MLGVFGLLCRLHKNLYNPPEISKSYFLNILDGYKDFYEVYTDTSKTQNRVGVFIILKNQYILFKLLNACSIFTAEATAILEAIKTIIKEEHSKFIMLRDSLSTLNYSIKSKFKPGDLTLKIQNKLNETAFINKQITRMWISGHMGIKGNEIADRQAKNATKTLIKVKKKNK